MTNPQDVTPMIHVPDVGATVAWFNRLSLGCCTRMRTAARWRSRFCRMRTV